MATTNFLQLLLIRSRVQISYLSCIFSFKIDSCEAVGVIFSALWHCTAKLLDFSFLLTVEKNESDCNLLRLAFGDLLCATY